MEIPMWLVPFVAIGCFVVGYLFYKVFGHHHHHHGDCNHDHKGDQK